jgi:hypothetical protein
MKSIHVIDIASAITTILKRKINLAGGIHYISSNRVNNFPYLVYECISSSITGRSKSGTTTGRKITDFEFEFKSYNTTDYESGQDAKSVMELLDNKDSEVLAILASIPDHESVKVIKCRFIGPGSCEKEDEAVFRWRYNLEIRISEVETQG